LAIVRIDSRKMCNFSDVESFFDYAFVPRVVGH
jgi:hypothetical protein